MVRGKKDFRGRVGGERNNWGPGEVQVGSGEGGKMMYCDR